MLCLEAAVANHITTGDAIKKVQEDVLTKCNEVFKGKRYKGYIKFVYERITISIQVKYLCYQTNASVLIP